MQKLTVFNNVSLDGYFTDAHGDMSWAHGGRHDPEFDAFVEGNASGDGTLLFGRRTYELMASYWPTPMALQAMPLVAARMNDFPKVVFSKSMTKASWSHTTVAKGELVTTVRAMKREAGAGMTLMGSGTLVAQLARAGLVDEYQFVLVPVVLGAGRTLFEGLEAPFGLSLIKTRAFANGNVVAWYAPLGGGGVGA